ncbi:hypothetical protein ECC02_013820 [Trypanosoma cruzi]|uniref:Mucin TcMUCII n=1 Tax=Trypanosoma cruzi TaxID=5693 RepID=A0A7J6XH80_TRYCR|nr:hypothetical protein ECC02_013820 [Trypanosoma cruzi]
MMAERDQDLPVRERGQMKCPISYRQMVIRVRQEDKMALIHPQIRQLRKPKILPRRQRRLQQRHQQRPPLPLRQRHQVLRLQRRQLRLPPAHRHVFAKSTAASAALRGCVPRWCSPHPRWRTPLWAEEVCAGCACQHPTAGFVRACCGSLYKIREIMIVFCFTCFCCRAVCSALCPASVALNASRTHLYACALEPWVCFSFLFNFFLIIVFYCFLNLCFAGRCASSAVVLIPSVSWCVRCCCWGAAICCCAVVVRGVAAVSIFLLPSLLTGS